MKCRSCDCILSDFEATRKEANTGQYVDLCNHCFAASDYTNIPILERDDLSISEDYEELE